MNKREYLNKIGEYFSEKEVTREVKEDTDETSDC